MAVYRFQVSFKDQPDIFRLIDIVGLQHFEIFHKTILKSVKFDEGELAAFYLNYATPNQIEIGLSDIQGDGEAMLMKDVKIQDIVNNKENPGFTYVYDFMNMWEFDIELKEIFPSSTPNVKYPDIVKSSGDAPLQEERDLKDEFEENDMQLIKDLLNSNKDAFGDEFLDGDEDFGEDEEQFY